MPLRISVVVIELSFFFLFFFLFWSIVQSEPEVTLEASFEEPCLNENIGHEPLEN